MYCICGRCAKNNPRQRKWVPFDADVVATWVVHDLKSAGTFSTKRQRKGSSKQRKARVDKEAVSTTSLVDSEAAYVPSEALSDGRMCRQQPARQCKLARRVVLDRGSDSGDVEINDMISSDSNSSTSSDYSSTSSDSDGGSSTTSAAYTTSSTSDANTQPNTQDRAKKFRRIGPKDGVTATQSTHLSNPHPNLNGQLKPHIPSRSSLGPTLGTPGPNGTSKPDPTPKELRATSSSSHASPSLQPRKRVHPSLLARKPLHPSLSSLPLFPKQVVPFPIPPVPQTLVVTHNTATHHLQPVGLLLKRVLKLVTKCSCP